MNVVIAMAGQQALTEVTDVVADAAATAAAAAAEHMAKRGHCYKFLSQAIPSQAALVRRWGGRRRRVRLERGVSRGDETGHGMLATSLQLMFMAIGRPSKWLFARHAQSDAA